MNIIEACEDKHLFAPLFKRPETWRPWKTALRVLFNLGLDDDDDIKLFMDSTGLVDLPTTRIKEAAFICGRRSGKSFISAIVAVYMACFRDWTPYLSPGERGFIFIIACDKMQAGIIKRYVSAILESSDMLRAMTISDKAESIDLKNHITIQVKTNSFRSIRGFSCLCCIMEETAYWRSEYSANPDREVLAAVRPSMATIPESMLILISTPYARRGILWDSFKKNFGQPGRALTWKQQSMVMNPTLDAEIIQEALAEDPQAAAAEWLCEWREDIESFLSFEALQACTATERAELPPAPGLKYYAAIDPSFLGQDSFTLAIAHPEHNGHYQVLDLVREWKPGQVDTPQVVQECATLIRAYNCYRTVSDRFSREWIRDTFRGLGIEVRFSQKSSSEYFLDLLPLITSRSVELLDNQRLIGQLANLERRTRSGGQDLVSHFSGQHDDLACAVAAAIVNTTMMGATVGVI